jgi:hypothetical protein
VSIFGQFGDENVDEVARKLDQELQNVLQKAVSPHGCKQA